jgi:hypothetical protein
MKQPKMNSVLLHNVLMDERYAQMNCTQKHQRVLSHQLSGTGILGGRLIVKDHYVQPLNFNFMKQNSNTAILHKKTLDVDCNES